METPTKKSEIADWIARAICIADGRDPELVLTINRSRGPYTGAPVDDAARPQWRYYEEHAGVVAAALKERGFVIVPREPTEAMVNRVENADNSIPALCVWQEMINAWLGEDAG